MSVSISNTVIARNRTEIGSHLMFPAQHSFWRSSQALAQGMPIRIMRLTDNALNSGNTTLCTSWNASTHTGTYNWSTFDATLSLNKLLGIQTLLCLGFIDSNGFKQIGNMPIQSSTGLPSPADYAGYVKDVVTHVNAMGFVVPFYELVNEPQFYFYPNWVWNDTKAGYFLAIYNPAYDAVKAIQPTALCGNDSALYTLFLQYWKAHGGRLDFISGHKYDSWGISYSDAQGLDMAENKFFKPFDSIHSEVDTARAYWGNLNIPVIFTEANWGAGFANGTDPRIQSPVGQAWCGIVAMNCIRMGVDFLHYFDWCSSTSWETANKQYGIGFGLVNTDDGVPREPYNVMKSIFSKLSLNDEVLQTTVSGNSNIRAQAWRHNGTVYCAVTNRGSGSAIVTIGGQTLSFSTYGTKVAEIGAVGTRYVFQQWGDGVTDNPRVIQV